MGGALLTHKDLDGASGWSEEKYMDVNPSYPKVAKSFGAVAG